MSQLAPIVEELEVLEPQVQNYDTVHINQTFRTINATLGNIQIKVDKIQIHPDETNLRLKRKNVILLSELLANQLMSKIHDSDHKSCPECLILDGQRKTLKTPENKMEAPEPADHEMISPENPALPLIPENLPHQLSQHSLMTEDVPVDLDKPPELLPEVSQTQSNKKIISKEPTKDTHQTRTEESENLVKISHPVPSTSTAKVLPTGKVVSKIPGKGQLLPKPKPDIKIVTLKPVTLHEGYKYSVFPSVDDETQLIPVPVGKAISWQFHEYQAGVSKPFSVRQILLERPQTLLQEVHLPPATFTVPNPTPKPWLALQPADDILTQSEETPLFTVGTSTVSPPAQPMETSNEEIDPTTLPSEFMELTDSVFQPDEEKDSTPATSTRRLSAQLHASVLRRRSRTFSTPEPEIRITTSSDTTQSSSSSEE
ncbi:unnamed protein product [Allacma fusca]|uniref:Uncharacterized protein n=1 Tax=Allacma fusca TaxID=39272 RepID=A0A8J2KVY9_9HEXA|nr:unnamed protein product [Allacma fusca]